MGIMDAFKGKQYKEEVEKLTKQLNQMQELLTPEMQDAMLLQQKIDDLKIQEKNQQQAVSQLYKNIEQLNNTISKLDKTIEDKKSQIVWMDDEILVQEFGLYTPKFDFASSLDYKEELAKIRSKQKELIKQGRAVSGVTNWQVNGSAAKGRKLVSDTQKLLLRAFNGECDELVSKVKYTNFDASLNKIQKSAETISKLGTVMNISICRGYLDAKIKELRLAFEYQQKKQEEKENAKEEAEKIQVTDLEVSDITQFSYVLDGTTLSFTKNGTEWTYDGDQSVDIDESALETLLNKASAITASDEVTEYDDLADFGLDDPANTVTLKTDSGLTTIYIGSQNEITNEYYLKTGDSDTIYVVDSAPATGFDKSVEDLTAKADDTETEAEEPSEAVDETETATVVPNETEAVVTEETK